MTKPLRVVVERPTRNVSAVVGDILGRVGAIFLAAWAVMLLLPGVIGWAPGYWQAVGLVLIVRFIMPNSEYLYWTANPRGGSK